MWIKSKDSGSKVQSIVASSIWNSTFGGTKLGWLGVMSVAITLAEGNSSAILLGTLVVV